MSIVSAFPGGVGNKKRLFTELILESRLWTCPDGVTSVNVRLFGGGGAGASKNEYGGGGGGGGHMAYASLEVIPGVGYPVTIGAGGKNNGGTGESGGITSFGTLLSASGGSAATMANGNGGDGGSGGGGHNYASGNGGNGSYGGGGGGRHGGNG
ncbi:MAG: hypothetical protein EOM69_03045, partial [Clostridia bacterium]|nr:hypothetical protein [Clostridia bacterium]